MAGAPLATRSGSLVYSTPEAAATAASTIAVPGTSAPFFTVNPTNPQRIDPTPLGRTYNNALGQATGSTGNPLANISWQAVLGVAAPFIGAYAGPVVASLFRTGVGAVQQSTSNPNALREARAVAAEAALQERRMDDEMDIYGYGGGFEGEDIYGYVGGPDVVLDGGIGGGGSVQPVVLGALGGLVSRGAAAVGGASVRAAGTSLARLLGGGARAAGAAIWQGANGVRVRMRDLWPLVRRHGPTAVATAMGISLAELGQMLMTPEAQQQGRRRRARGVSARDIKNARRTIKIIKRMYALIPTRPGGRSSWRPRRRRHAHYFN